MLLIKVKIQSFRGYLEKTEIPLGKLTSIVGKNDAGKSTIFSALDSFFNETKRDLEDINKGSSENSFSVSCCFTDLPQENIVIDTSNPTTIEQEKLLNSSGELEIIKEFKISSTSSQSLKPDVYIIAKQPESKYAPLHTLTITKLREIAQSLGINKDSLRDARTCSDYRNAIWSKLVKEKASEKDIRIPVNKEDAKKIYDQLEKYLPNFFIFSVDRESLDSDSEVKDPLQAAAKQSMTNYEKTIAEVYEKIVEDVNQVAARTLEKLHELHPTLASHLSVSHAKKPEIKFDFSLKDERGVRINRRGSGTRRLILLSFLRAQAEDPQATTKNIIYAVEEPESSQHPNNQELIVKSLMQLSEQENRQVLLTSHIPKMVEYLPAKSIVFIEQDVDKDIVHVHTGEDALSRATKSLGVLGDLPKIAKKAKVIFVEGRSDEKFLNKLCDILKNSGNISKTLSDQGCIIIPQNGKDSVKKWALNRWAERALDKYAYFLDSDKTSANDETDNTEFKKECDIAGVVCVLTARREIENYINPKTVKRTKGKEVVIQEYTDAKDVLVRETRVSDKQLIDCFWIAAQDEEILEGPKDEYLRWIRDLS